MALDKKRAGSRFEDLNFLFLLSSIIWVFLMVNKKFNVGILFTSKVQNRAVHRLKKPLNQKVYMYIYIFAYIYFSEKRYSSFNMGLIKIMGKGAK